MAKSLNIGSIIDGIGQDEEFISRLDDFLYSGYERYSASDRLAKLHIEEMAVNNRLTELLKDHEQAAALFRKYENISCSMEGEATGFNYERGFSDGVKFMVAILGTH